MAKSRYKWDVIELNSAVGSLKQASDNLRNRRNEMDRQRTEIGLNWQSPAGRDYQARLESDIEGIDNVLKELDEQIKALDRADDQYEKCEEEVKRATGRLPR